MKLARSWVSALCAILLVVATATVPARAASPLALTVRVYNSAGLSADTILATGASAAPILRDTGVDVTFRYCGTTDARTPGFVDACDDRLSPNEVVVRIIDAPLDATHLDPLAFGLTYVMRETNRGWLATVFADRILSAAHRVGVDSATLTGRVLAHEVGHLLLGQEYHGAVGVMRAHWPDQLIAGSSRSEWRFSMREAATIQQNLLMR
jgi:hypothetical protein